MMQYILLVYSTARAALLIKNTGIVKEKIDPENTFVGG